MLVQTMEFAVVVKNGVIVQVGRPQIVTPKTNFKGGEIKWFDDSKLLRKELSK